jgi:hypothetical protein
MKRDTKGAAERIGLSPKTLENRRSIGGGPPYFKLGGRVVYDDCDVDAWMQANRRTSTSQQAPGPA